MKVIGLVGLKGSGKTTTLETISKIHDTVEIQLARHLKDVCANVFDVSRDHFDDQNHKEVPFKVNRVISEKDLIMILDQFDLLNKYNLEASSVHVGKELRSPREVAQYIGSDVLRALEPDVHIKTSIKRMDPEKLNVVSDIRFHNEFDYFKSSIPHFFSLYVDRPEVTPKDLHLAPVSERHVPAVGAKCDVSVLNTGSKVTLEKIVSDLISGNNF